MEHSRPTVFVCDDNEDNCELIKFALELEGYRVTSCDNLEECLRQARENNFQAIVLDNRFGGTTSLEVCRQIRELNRSVPIIFYSGESRPSEIEKAFAAGASAYLVKPGDFDKLPGTIKKIIEERG